MGDLDTGVEESHIAIQMIMHTKWKNKKAIDEAIKHLSLQILCRSVDMTDTWIPWILSNLIIHIYQHVIFLPPDKVIIFN